MALLRFTSHEEARAALQREDYSRGFDPQRMRRLFETVHRLMGRRARPIHRGVLRYDSLQQAQAFWEGGRSDT